MFLPIIKLFGFTAGVFGKNGCKSLWGYGPLLNPVLKRGTCCRWDANCHNENSCMYCDPKDGNSFSLVGGQGEGQPSGGGKYCGSSRVCGQY